MEEDAVRKYAKLIIKSRGELVSLEVKFKYYTKEEIERKEQALTLWKIKMKRCMPLIDPTSLREEDYERFMEEFPNFKLE